ncbi:MAG: hypothetical protein QXY45_03800, partial [Candidatus Aenigmatarchaeota archaeon]
MNILYSLYQTNTTNAVNFIYEYTQSLPILIRQGDLGAIIIASVLFLISLFILNKITSWMLAFIKKTIFLFITALAVYYLSTDFYRRLMMTGPTFNTIFLGFFGTSIGLIGIYLSIKTWFKGFKESI